jgi:hypothetical protein
MRSLFLAILMLVVSGPGLLDCWAVEQADQTSILLSTYLHQCRLPLVEARVIPSPGGDYTLLLYGFVASESGKSDAESQALDFLDDPALEISNLIKVRPELLGLNSPGDGTWVASSDAPTTDESAIDKSTVELGSPGAENAADSSDAVIDGEAERPLDSFDNDE